MTRYLFIGLVLCSLVWAGDKKPPQGHVEDENVSIDATFLTPAEVTETVGTDFGGLYTVLSVRVTPKGGKPYDIHIDDFILRNQSQGDYSGPMLAEQIAGAEALEVNRTYGPRSSAEMPKIVTGMKVDVREQPGEGSHLAQLKPKMLVDQTTKEPQSGLMFFPMQKQKPHGVVLSCTTPSSKLRLQFK